VIGVKMGGRLIKNLRYADDTTLAVLSCKTSFSSLSIKGFESWVLTKADQKHVDALFELWY